MKEFKVKTTVKIVGKDGKGVKAQDIESDVFNINGANEFMLFNEELGFFYHPMSSCSLVVPKKADK